MNGLKQLLRGTLVGSPEAWVEPGEVANGSGVFRWTPFSRDAGKTDAYQSIRVKCLKARWKTDALCLLRILLDRGMS